MVTMIELYLHSDVAREYFTMIHCTQFKEYGDPQMILVGSKDNFTFSTTGIEFKTKVRRSSGVREGIATIPYHAVAGTFRYEQEGDPIPIKVVGFDTSNSLTSSTE